MIVKGLFNIMHGKCFTHILGMCCTTLWHTQKQYHGNYCIYNYTLPCDGIHCE